MTFRLLMMFAIVFLATQPRDATRQAAADGPLTPTPISELWAPPTHLESRDLFNGPWGAEYAPDPDAIYRRARRAD